MPLRVVEFTWRKKWERNWNEVMTCSKRCKTERRRQQRRLKRSCAADAKDSTESTQSSRPEPATSKSSRRSARKATKLLQRELRAGNVPGAGQKKCQLCDRSVDLLVRCQLDTSSVWYMVCGKCWKLPNVSGGVPDGDGRNPHYRYGGLWKNLHKL